MGETDLSPAGIKHDIVRIVLSVVLDKPAFGLLNFMYQLFFNVASVDIFSNDTVMKFYSRVQLILGVYMMFQLAMTIIKGIVNPDTFFSADKGAGNLIMRIVVALFLLTALVPINIPSPRNEFEKQINNNGLLFGTLYSLQHRLLSNDTLGRLILGTNDGSTNYVSDSDDADTNLKRSARIFTSTVLKCFYRINLKSDEPDAKPVCSDINSIFLTEYQRIDSDPQTIISWVNKECHSDPDGWGLWEGIQDAYYSTFGDDYYIFAYNGFISAIVAFLFAFILLSFSIDVAVRVIKLGVLRLIAPIPIISYMDPKGSKDSAFNAWVKTLTSTFLDLFMRLAVVYFVLFLIQSMMENGIIMNHGSGILGVMTYIIIWIGLFIFAKQAPKFFRKVLGLKEDGGKFFSGISDALGVGAAAAGVVSGAVSGASANFQTTTGNTGKKLLSGMVGFGRGAVGGGVNAGKQLFGGKEIDRRAIMESNRKYAAQNYSNAADESTAFGRFKAGSQANLGLKNDLQQFDEKIKYFNAAKDAMGRMNDAFSSNGDAKVVYNGADITDRNGHTILAKGTAYSLKDYKDKLNRVQSSGDDELIEKVDSAMKFAQGERLAHLRSTFTGKDREEARNKLIDKINAEADKERAERAAGRKYTMQYTQRDLDVFDGAYTIYNVAQKYSDESFFSGFKGKKFEDMPADYADAAKEWGGLFKRAASTAGDTAKSLQASPEYDQAKANAQRVAEKKK